MNSNLNVVEADDANNGRMSLVFEFDLENYLAEKFPPLSRLSNVRRQIDWGAPIFQQLDEQTLTVFKREVRNTQCSLKFASTATIFDALAEFDIWLVGQRGKLLEILPPAVVHTLADWLRSQWSFYRAEIPDEYAWTEYLWDYLRVLGNSALVINGAPVGVIPPLVGRLDVHPASRETDSSDEEVGIQFHYYHRHERYQESKSPIPHAIVPANLCDTLGYSFSILRRSPMEREFDLVLRLDYRGANIVATWLANLGVSLDPGAYVPQDHRVVHALVRRDISAAVLSTMLPSFVAESLTEFPRLDWELQQCAEFAADYRHTLLDPIWLDSDVLRRTAYTAWNNDRRRLGLSWRSDFDDPRYLKLRSRLHRALPKNEPAGGAQLAGKDYMEKLHLAAELIDVSETLGFVRQQVLLDAHRLVSAALENLLRAVFQNPAIVFDGETGQSLYVRFNNESNREQNTAVDLSESCYVLSDSAIKKTQLSKGTYIVEICVGRAAAQTPNDAVACLVRKFVARATNIGEDAKLAIVFDGETRQNLYVRFNDESKTAVDLESRYVLSDSGIKKAKLSKGTYIVEICVGTAAAQAPTDVVLACFVRKFVARSRTIGEAFGEWIIEKHAGASKWDKSLYNQVVEKFRRPDTTSRNSSRIALSKHIDDAITLAEKVATDKKIAVKFTPLKNLVGIDWPEKGQAASEQESGATKQARQKVGSAAWHTILQSFSDSTEEGYANTRLAGSLLIAIRNMLMHGRLTGSITGTNAVANNITALNQDQRNSENDVVVTDDDADGIRFRLDGQSLEYCFRMLGAVTCAVLLHAGLVDTPSAKLFRQTGASKTATPATTN